MYKKPLIIYKKKIMFKYSREYPIRTDVVFQPNKFQAYHFKPLSQFSFLFSIRLIIILLSKYIKTLMLKMY
jgi:hypothetical protein